MTSARDRFHIQHLALVHQSRDYTGIINTKKAASGRNRKSDVRLASVSSWNKETFRRSRVGQLPILTTWTPLLERVD